MSKSPYGENANHRTAKMQREVDSLELAPKEELPSGSSKALPSANQFANRKISNGDPDPRFASFKDYYFSEFQNRFRDVKPAFDASDGSAIKRLLKQQRDAATETLISWLRNAFESDDVPPLRPGFRMREFCAHATKYTTGPILRTGSCRTTSDWDNSQQGKFEKIVQ
ncbi:MAG: hypothetical protein ACRD5M_05010 [Candidatus Acidiferrales bacterium]